MRIFVKGGVWKNTEDEILKAAVMKYGKNNWNRVASLLTRKNGAQCKARWFEWLDPSIKKIDWSREEDEKLLHLAKIMPTQWRTIAPIVGRTAGQCLERYEVLLDAAQKRDGEMEADDDNLDPRRLRVGEIDPNPESRPARPDPIDMDDDEKEMLSEARARLANTRGKKAKRKAREKQLMEAKRLASLQKKRELKAAGIFTSGPPRKKRKGFMDYNEEVPFEKEVPIGFHDVSEELQKDKDVTGREFKMIQVNKLEEKRRDEEEARQQSKDKRKFQNLQKMNLPLAIAMVSEANDPMNYRKRSKLSLPEPSISEAELGEIVKASSAASSIEIVEGGSDATNSLIGTYNVAPIVSTPMRTPANSNQLISEARNHIALMRTQTPLMGGDNAELDGSGTGFDGAKPNTLKMATPSVLAEMTPGMTPRMTPGRGSVASTPLRDQFKLNTGDSTAMIISDPKAEKMRQKQAAYAVQRGFLSLPAPEDKYDIVTSNVLPEDVSNEMEIEEDASDRAARLAIIEAEEREEELRSRSQVIQRDLPRPLTVNTDDLGKHVGETPENLIAAEELHLLMHDASKYPLKEGKRKNVSLVEIDKDLLNAARAMLNKEISIVRKEVESNSGNENIEKWWENWTQAFQGIVLFRGKYVPVSSLSSDQVAESLMKEFEFLKEQIQNESKKASKLQQKAEILTAGYAKKSAGFSETMHAANLDNRNLEIELACYKMLSNMEREALPKRMKSISEEVATQEVKEKQLQQTFETLMNQRETLKSLLA